MLDEYLAGLEKEEQTRILRALLTLKEAGFFDSMLRQELHYLANSASSQVEPAKIHESIIGFKAKEAFFSSLKAAIPTGD